MHERLQEIREAITRLQGHLRKESVPEEDLQDWFESNPVVFEALNYEDHVSHPKLPLPGDKELIPDLMGKTVKKEWEVIELKRPSTKIIKDKERRNTFYAKLNEYIQKCTDYSKYFTDSRNVDNFEEENSFRVNGRVKSRLIAGRNDAIDRREVFEKLGERGHWVEVITYDDILNFLKSLKAKAFVEHEGLPGISIFFLMIPIDRRHEHRNQIAMIGKENTRNMVSVHFDISGNLVFEVKDKEGNTFKTKISQDDGDFRFGKPTYLLFELGRGDGYSTVSIEVNGFYNSFNITDPIDIDLGTENMPYVIGSDCHGHRNSGFGLYSNLIVARTLHLDEKMKMLNRYNHLLHESPGDEGPILFEDGQFLHSDPHPNFN